MSTTSSIHRPIKISGSSAGGAALRPRAAQHASRVTNGCEILPGVDGRSAGARRYHDICASIIDDLGDGEHMTEVRFQLIRRFAAAAVLAEQMEAKFANGETIDIGEHAHLTSTLVRVAQRIGVNKLKPDTISTLEEYLASKRDEAESESGEVDG